MDGRAGSDSRFMDRRSSGSMLRVQRSREERRLGRNRRDLVAFLLDLYVLVKVSEDLLELRGVPGREARTTCEPRDLSKRREVGDERRTVPSAAVTAAVPTAAVPSTLAEATGAKVSCCCGVHTNGPGCVVPKPIV